MVVTLPHRTAKVTTLLWYRHTNTFSLCPGLFYTKTQTRDLAPIEAGLERPGPIGLARLVVTSVTNAPIVYLRRHPDVPGHVVVRVGDSCVGSSVVHPRT